MQLVNHSLYVNVTTYILGVKECDRLSLKNMYPTFSGIWLVCKGYNFSSLFLGKTLAFLNVTLLRNCRSVSEVVVNKEQQEVDPLLARCSIPLTSTVK